MARARFRPPGYRTFTGKPTKHTFGPTPAPTPTGWPGTHPPGYAPGFGHDFHFTGAEPGGFNPDGVFPTPDQTPMGYDPALDAQGQNEALGYLWNKQDYTRDWNSDPNATDAQGNPLGYGRQFHDFGNRLSDYIKGHTQAQQDFETQRGGIRQNYQRLGDSQSQRAAAMGVAEGGALVQAMQKRTANQGQDIGRVDTAAGRETDQFNTEAGNATVDANGVFHPGTTGRLSDVFQRGLDDANQYQGRQDITHTMFGQQLNSEKAYAGEVPGLPAGMHQYGNDPANPQYWRQVTHKGVTYRQNQDGSMRPIRKVNGKWHNV